MHKITFQDWHISCVEPNCCDEYGTHLRINGELICSQIMTNAEELSAILTVLNVDFEIEELESDEQ